MVEHSPQILTSEEKATITWQFKIYPKIYNLLKYNLLYLPLSI